MANADTIMARSGGETLHGKRIGHQLMASDHRGVVEAARSGCADPGVCLRLVSEEAGPYENVGAIDPRNLMVVGASETVTLKFVRIVAGNRHDPIQTIRAPVVGPGYIFLEVAGWSIRVVCTETGQLQHVS